MTPFAPTNVLIETKKCPNPECNGWQLRKIVEPIADARFSIQHGGLVQDFKVMWECPRCEILLEFDEQDDENAIPF